MKLNKGVLKSAISTRPGETLENKVKRITANNEPIKDGAEMIYQKESYYVNPECNPRTDTREIAILAMDHVNKSRWAKRNGNTEIGKVEKQPDNNGTETNNSTV